MNHPELHTVTNLYAPVIGMHSLVGVGSTDYPIKFGNYCALLEGTYLCNMWAENLREWAKRNPDSGPIEVTTVSHGDRQIGYVSDARLKDWCNKRWCVTGHGWPSVAAMRHICEALGFPEDDVCGCETEYQPPRIGHSWTHAAAGKSEVTTITNRCAYCGRKWETTKA